MKSFTRPARGGILMDIAQAGNRLTRGENVMKATASILVIAWLALGTTRAPAAQPGPSAAAVASPAPTMSRTAAIAALCQAVRPGRRR